MSMATEINNAKIKITLDPQTLKGQVGVPVRVQGLQGPQGPQGVSGVWLSTTPPTEEGYEVWIDPEGEETPMVNTVNGQTGNIVVQTRHNEMSNSDILDIWENS